MAKTNKKGGQKLEQDFSRALVKVSEKSKTHIKENFIGRISHIGNIRLLIFEWALLISALIMLAVTQALWFVDSYAEDSFTNDGTYSEATLGSVNSLNPLFATTNSERTLSRLMFATLSQIDYSGHPGIGLAESILPSDGGKTWTVRLRDGLKWSDNEPITNDDVLFTANLIKNPNLKSSYDTNLANVTTSINEQNEVVFSLPKPYADFSSALNFPILPKHKLENVDPRALAENDFSTSPITSGPFKYNAVQNTADKDERIFYLSSNPNYYGGEPLLDTFAVHTYSSPEAIVNALNTGVVTATAELTEAEASQVTSGQMIKKNSMLNSGVYLFFNTTSDSLAIKDLRAAIRQGLNLEKIRAISPENTALDYPLLPSQISSVVSFPALPAQDFAAAKGKIDEITGESTPTLEIATLDTDLLPEITHEIASQLETLGFQTNVSIYDQQNQDFLTQRAYDLLVFQIDLGADPDLLPYYHSMHANKSGINLSNYRNALVDDLLLGARDTLDPVLRSKKYETFLNYWVNDIPAIGLFQSNLTYFYNRNARSFGNNLRLVSPFDRFTDVTDWSVNKQPKNLTP